MHRLAAHPSSGSVPSAQMMCPPASLLAGAKNCRPTLCGGPPAGGGAHGRRNCMQAGHRGAQGRHLRTCHMHRCTLPLTLGKERAAHGQAVAAARPEAWRHHCVCKRGGAVTADISRARQLASVAQSMQCSATNTRLAGWALCRHGWRAAGCACAAQSQLPQTPVAPGRQAGGAVGRRCNRTCLAARLAART